jgi:hypothetical protein
MASCGAEAPRARTPPPAEFDAGRLDATPGDATDAYPEDAAPSAAAIARGGASVAPGMRELERMEGPTPLTRSLIKGADQDRCVKIAFAADERVSISVLGEAGAVLAELPPAQSGVTTTVCVRRGGELSVRVLRRADAGLEARVGAVAFTAP